MWWQLAGGGRRWGKGRGLEEGVAACGKRSEGGGERGKEMGRQGSAHPKMPTNRENRGFVLQNCLQTAKIAVLEGHRGRWVVPGLPLKQNEKTLVGLYFASGTQHFWGRFCTARARRPAVHQLSRNHPENNHHRGSYVRRSSRFRQQSGIFRMKHTLF